MLKKILRGLFTIIGLILGYLIGEMLLSTSYFVELNYFKNGTIQGIIFIIFSTLIFGVILFLISPIIVSFIMKLMDYVEKSIQKMPTAQIIFGTGGAIFNGIKKIHHGFRRKDFEIEEIITNYFFIKSVYHDMFSLEYKRSILFRILKIDKILKYFFF